MTLEMMRQFSGATQMTLVAVSLLAGHLFFFWMPQAGGALSCVWHSELWKVAVGLVVSLPCGCAGGAAGASAGKGSTAIGKHILASGDRKSVV